MHLSMCTTAVAEYVALPRGDRGGVVGMPWTIRNPCWEGQAETSPSKSSWFPSVLVGRTFLAWFNTCVDFLF